MKRQWNAETIANHIYDKLCIESLSRTPTNNSKTIQFEREQWYQTDLSLKNIYRHQEAHEKMLSNTTHQVSVN